MKFGLTHETISKIKTVFKKFKIVQVKIFGSRAKGNYKPGSDIDLAVLSDLQSKEFNKLKNALDDLNLPYLFDICLYNEIENADLREHINRVGILF